MCTCTCMSDVHHMIALIAAPYICIVTVYTFTHYYCGRQVAKCHKCINACSVKYFVSVKVFFCKMLLPMTVKLTVVFYFLVCCWALQDKYSREMDSRNGSCPPWYYRDDEDKCSFSHQLPQIVNQYGNTSELEMGYCMTRTNSSLVVTGCPYTPNAHNLSQYHSIYQVLPKQLDQVNDSLCAALKQERVSVQWM